MIIPIRCFTCNKVVANLWEKYLKLLKNGDKENEALDKLGLDNYCCRRMLLSNYEINTSDT